MSSIEARHAYRFSYLKSDHWQNLRLEKLVSKKAKCECCGFESPSNDVHHLDYKHLYDVELSDLVVLCRDCHSKAHEIIDTKKARGESNPIKYDEQIMVGWMHWKQGGKNKNPLAILAYILFKSDDFELLTKKNMRKSIVKGFKAKRHAYRDWLNEIILPPKIPRLEYGVRHIFISAKIHWTYRFPHNP